MADDIFDVVNERDEVVSSAPRSVVHARNLLHRSAQVLIFCDSVGGRKILLQKRSKYKDRHPLKYTASCSGHIDSGETYEQGAVREMLEETGIVCVASQLVEIGKLTPSEATGWEFAKVYEYICSESEKLSFPEDEVESLEWIDIPYFERLISENPELFTPMFLEVYSFYLSKTLK